MDDTVADIRAFNRFYTRLIGVLDAGHMQTPYTLTEARALYEIGRRGSVAPGELARALKLDAGYLSRLNQRLGELGLVTVASSETDRRSSVVALTADGEAVVTLLSDATDRSISALLEPLDAGRRNELVTAMQAIERLLGSDTVRGAILLRPSRLGDFGWLIHRQALIYNQQFGWNVEFEALIAGIYSAYQSAPQSPPKDLWIAEQDGVVAGSIFVQPSDGLEGSAQLRMLYVEPAARGQGIGAALVAQAVSFACEAGYERMRLWTHANQDSARKLYAVAGFAIVETMPEHNFGKDLTGEIWEIRF
jgi:DNA-binding MarR family transcriptional regulator/GNAT superfamily N-acetyltransferase